MLNTIPRSSFSPHLLWSRSNKALVKSGAEVWKYYRGHNVCLSHGSLSCFLAFSAYAMSKGDIMYGRMISNIHLYLALLFVDFQKKHIKAHQVHALQQSKVLQTTKIQKIWLLQVLCTACQSHSNVNGRDWSNELSTHIIEVLTNTIESNTQVIEVIRFTLK